MTFVPRPILTFAVGIVGHRADKLGNAGDLTERLSKVYDVIDRVCDRQFRDARDAYAPNPAPAPTKWRVRLLTGFAEGADQIAAGAAPGPWEVEAILPAPREVYREELGPERSSDHTDRRAEFDAALKRAGDRILELPAVIARKAPRAPAPTVAEEATAQQASYARQAGFLLKQIDLLIAVWDGEPTEERGTTGDTVAKALRGGVPVVWIPADGKTAPVFLSEPDDLEGDIESTALPAFEARLTEAITRLVQPPEMRRPRRAPSPASAPRVDASTIFCPTRSSGKNAIARPMIR